MNTAIKKSSYMPFMSALLLFFFMKPYYVWGVYHYPFIRICLMLILCFLFYKHKDQQPSKKTSNLANLFCATVIMSVFIMMFHGHANFFGMIDVFMKAFLVFMVLSTSEFKMKVFDSYLTLYSVVILLSLFAWLLLPMGLLPDLGLISSYDADNRWFTHYPFLVIERSMAAFRFNGPFDEPGVVGTIGALLLCINKFNIKDKRVIVVLVSSILSFSFFFYAIVSVYIIFYLLFVKKKFLWVLVLAAGFAIFYQKTKDDPLLYGTLWERAEWDPDANEFKGDNRSNEDANYIFESKRGTSEYYWGLEDIELYNSYAAGSCTYKNVIASYGLVFFVFYCSFFILLGYDRRVVMFNLLLYCLVLFANLYQRPSIYVPHIVFLFIVFAETIKTKKYSLINI